MLPRVFHIQLPMLLCSVGMIPTVNIRSLLPLLALVSVALPAPQSAAPVFTEFGYEWQPRSGALGAGSPWSADGITRFTKTGGPNGFTNRRIGLSAESASCGLKLMDVPAPAKVTVYIEGALFALDPNVVAAVWFYDDGPGLGGGTELDWEYSSWRDTHNPFRHYLGIHREGVHTTKAPVPTTSAIYHKIVLSQTETASTVAVFDWRESDSRWIEITTGSFAVSSKPGATLRIGLWRSSAHAYIRSRRGESKIYIGGIVVEKL